ncbi:MAG: septum formation family protein [Nocardioidaceae bacterium]
MRLTRLAAVLAVAAATLVGCSSGGGPDASGTPSPSTSGAATEAAPNPKAPPPPAAPRNEACYRLTLQQLAQPTSSTAPTGCGAQHDTQTIYVGRLRTVVDGHAVTVDSDTVQRQLASTCPRRLASYLGGTTQTLDLSRFHVVWFSPTLAQSDQGAAWFRCDLIAFARGDVLFRLPPPAKLRGALGRPGALSTYGLCGTAAPGARDFERVICAQKHSWQAFSTIALAGGRRYPGVAAVRGAGDATCKSQAQARAGNALKYQYGWEWPTSEQWTGGQHYGYCWMPS